MVVKRGAVGRYRLHQGGKGFYRDPLLGSKSCYHKILLQNYVHDSL